MYVDPCYDGDITVASTGGPPTPLVRRKMFRSKPNPDNNGIYHTRGGRTLSIKIIRFLGWRYCVPGVLLRTVFKRGNKPQKNSRFTSSARSTRKRNKSGMLPGPPVATLPCRFFAHGTVLGVVRARHWQRGLEGEPGKCYGSHGSGARRADEGRIQGFVQQH